MKKGCKIAYVIGEAYTNIWDQKFKVVGYTDNVRERIVEFESGCIKTVLTSSIKNRKIKDFNQRAYYGVGYLGMDRATKHYLWYRWFNMIGRCYDKNHCNYQSYGGKGIYVEEYLLSFKNYVEFIESLPNADKLRTQPKEWEIDKDLKSGLYYSRETITILRKEDNLELENKNKRIKVFMFSLENKYINEFESINEAESKTGIPKGNIARVIRGESKTAGGYKWSDDGKEVLSC